MKMIKALTALMFGFFAISFAQAQTVDLTKGDLALLKGETTINIEFTYEKMTVGDDGKEEAYIKRKRQEMNDKEHGSGEIWAAKWDLDKKDKFEPKFILGFTKENKMTVSPTAKYTLIFNTRALEPGYQVGISKKNAGIDGTVTIVETANRDKKLIVLMVERPGENKWRGAAFDAGSRIADAYFLTGQKVGKFIQKEIK
jgi:hypothetical protein